MSEIDQKGVKKKKNKTHQQHQDPIMLICVNPCFCLNQIAAILKCNVLFSYCLAIAYFFLMQSIMIH